MYKAIHADHSHGCHGLKEGVCLDSAGGYKSAVRPGTIRPILNPKLMRFRPLQLHSTLVGLSKLL